MDSASEVNLTIKKKKKKNKKSNKSNQDDTAASCRLRQEKTFHPDSTHLRLGVFTMFFSAPFGILSQARCLFI